MENKEERLEIDAQRGIYAAVVTPTLKAESQVSGTYQRDRYVDKAQMKKAKDAAYGDKKTTKDAYTGETIHRDHKAAKNKYKGNASSHQGETDHTVSAKAAYDYAKHLPHITDADVKAAVNRQHNFREISKRNNTSKREKSNSQHAKDSKDLSTKAKVKMAAEGAKETILVKGELTLKSAGRDSVDISKRTAAVNLAQFIQGEKTLSEAAIDTVTDTIKGEVTAMTIRAGAGAAETVMTKAGEELAKHAAKEGVLKNAGELTSKTFNTLGAHASDIAMVAMQCAGAVRSYIDGDIDAPDMLLQIGESAAMTVVMQAGSVIGGNIGASIGATIGSVISLGPGTVVGYLVGELVGNIVGGAIAYIIGSRVCAGIAKFVRVDKYIAEQERIQQMYSDFAAQTRKSRIALEQYLEYLHTQHREYIRLGFQQIEEGYQAKDANKISQALDYICTQFELVTEFKTREEFEEKLADHSFVFKIGNKPSGI